MKERQIMLSPPIQNCSVAAHAKIDKIELKIIETFPFFQNKFQVMII